MNDRQVSKLFWVVRALLAGALLYVVVAVVVTPLHLGRPLKPRAASGGDGMEDIPSTRPRARPIADVSAVIESNLFTADSIGQPQPLGEDLLGSMAAADELLGLRLIGVVAGSRVTSRAIIQNTTTKLVNPYKVGDTVASATIESIRPDSVILCHEGERMALRLQTGAGASSEHAPAPVAAERPAGPPGATSVTAGTAAPQPLGRVEDVLRQATIEPYVKNGRTLGLKVTGLEKMPLAGAFGLRDGDVITTINGQNLTNKQKAFQVLQKARTQSNIEIEFLRDGKTKNLAFDRQ